MKKRILQIIPTLDRSGAEKQMVMLAAGLPEDEFDVHVCTLTRLGPLEHDLKQAGIPIYNVRKKLKIDPFAFARLKSIIRNLKPDLVHTWIFAANSYGRKAAIECEVPRIVAGERCVDPWKSRLHFYIDKRLATKTDLIITNSSGVRDFYAARGFDPGQFRVIPNGVAAYSPPVEAATKNELLRELGIIHEGDPLVIGIVARLWPQKRLKDAIFACETLRFVKLNFHLLIFGDGPERERLLRYRDELDLSDRVHFLGHRDDVARFLPHFDLLWCTSEYEGQSNSILEAMSAGIPVIASDIPGNRDMVVNDETGVLVPDFAEDFRRRRSMLVEQTRRLIEDPKLRSEMGAASQKRIAEQFSVEKMIEQHAETYRELLGCVKLKDSI